jgi:hypothetical protein
VVAKKNEAPPEGAVKESIVPTSPPWSTLTLLQRLAKVQGEVDYIQKEKKPGMKYSIVSHDAVTAKVRPLMVKYGVLYYPVYADLSQVGNRTQMQMSVRFVNVDDGTDFIDVVSAGYGIDEQDKGPGKAISYSVKYALLKVLGLESGDDPDEDQTTVHSDPANEHNLAMTAFEVDIDNATEIDQLEKAALKHKVALEKAMAVYPARVLQARQAYAKRLRFLKGG